MSMALLVLDWTLADKYMAIYYGDYRIQLGTVTYLSDSLNRPLGSGQQWSGSCGLKRADIWGA